MRQTIRVLTLLDLALCLACVALLYFVLYLDDGPINPLIVIVPSVLAYTLTIVLSSLGADHARRIGLPGWGRVFSLLLVLAIVGPILAPVIFLAGALANFSSQAPTTMATTTVISFLLLLPPSFTPAYALLYVVRSRQKSAPEQSA